MSDPTPLTPPPAPAPTDDLTLAKELATAAQSLRAELAKSIVGQQDVIEQLLIALFARGHCLLQGVPGLAKTLIVQTLAKATSLSFSRIQFTPDLMPGDITGTDVLQDDPITGRRSFSFVPGPLFANLLLADEINRTPPKTQSALLQAMQERQVTAGLRTMSLPDPFMVLATQNPIEQEGTYPLPEAQLDRFMFMILVRYPTRDDELTILKQTTTDAATKITPILTADKINAYRDLIRRVPVGEAAYAFATDLARATRPDEKEAPDFIRHWLSWGAGPRAGQALILAAKARAVLSNRLHATLEDLTAVAPPVLRHRLVPNFNAEAEGITVDQIIQKLLTQVPRPGGGKRLL